MKLICIGDSLTYGYDVPASCRWTSLLAAETGMMIENCGECGDTTMGMRHRFFSDVLEKHPDCVIIMGGSNDILSDVPFETIKTNVSCMIHCAGEVEISVIVGIPPLTKKESSLFGWQNAGDVDRHNFLLTEYRKWLMEQSRLTQFPVIDFCKAMNIAERESNRAVYADGLHPNAEGYAVFAHAAKQVFETTRMLQHD